MRRSFAWASPLLIALALNVALPARASLDNSLTSYVLRNPVTVDGRWTTANEWSDAAEVALQEFTRWGKYDRTHNTVTGEAYARVKHDSDYVYILLDSVTNPEFDYVQMPDGPTNDAFTVAIDAEKNRGPYPEPDDTDYWVAYYGEVAGRETGDGTGVYPYWQHQENLDFTYAYSTDAKNDPHSRAPHVIVEFRIPLTGNSEVGFFLEVNDAHGDGRCLLVWPEGSNSIDTSSWGTLVISPDVYPTTTSTTSYAETTLESSSPQATLGGDVDLVKIEPVQSVYGDDVPLVAGKPTVVCATIRSTFPVTVPLSVAIHYGNEQLSSREMVSPNEQEYCFPSRPMYFVIPDPGEIDISMEVHVEKVGAIQGENREDNNKAGPVHKEVIQTEGRTIMFVPVGVDGGPAPPSRDNMDAICEKAYYYIRGVFPLASETGFAWFYDPIIMQSTDTDKAFARLEAMRTDPRYDYDIVVGLVGQGWFAEEHRGASRGSVAVAESTDLVFASHEVGHILGLSHPWSKEYNADGFWPEALHASPDYFRGPYHNAPSLMNAVLEVTEGGETAVLPWITQDNYLALLRKFQTTVTPQSALSGRIFEDQRILFTTFVPQDVVSLTTTVSYGGSSVRVTVTDPIGNHYEATQVSSTQDLLKVHNPSYGNWYISLMGTDLPREGEKFNVELTLERRSGPESFIPYLYWIAPVALAAGASVFLLTRRDRFSLFQRRNHFCIECGSPLRAGAKYCLSCGEEIKRRRVSR